MPTLRSLFVSLALVLTAGVARPAEVTIAVIVHPSREAPLSRQDVARMFLRKQRFWADGSPILPLNRDAGSELRESFSFAVFGVATTGLATYWNQQYFLGTLPPATLHSSEAVRRYVAAEPNAIGYVETGIVDESVRVAVTLGSKAPRSLSPW